MRQLISSNRLQGQYLQNKPQRLSGQTAYNYKGTRLHLFKVILVSAGRIDSDDTIWVADFVSVSVVCTLLPILSILFSKTIELQRGYHHLVETCKSRNCPSTQYQFSFYLSQALTSNMNTLTLPGIQIIEVQCLFFGLGSRDNIQLQHYFVL